MPALPGAGASAVAPRRGFRWFRWLIRAGGLAFLLCVALLVYAMRPARLRAELGRSLAARGISLDRLDAISFTPWAGLELVALEIRPASNSGASPFFELSVPYLHVAVDPWSILSGQVRMTGVSARSPHLSLSSECLTQERSDQWPASLVRELPRVQVKAADIAVLGAGPERSILRRVVLDIEGERRGDAYGLRIQQVGGAGLGVLGAGRETPLVDMTWDGARLEGSLDWTELEVGIELMPAETRRALAEFAPSGEARVERFAVGPHGLEAIHLALRDMSLSLPIEAPGETGPLDRYLRVQGAAGELRFERLSKEGAGWRVGRMEARLAGAIRDGAVEFSCNAAEVVLSAAEAGDPRFSATAYEASLRLDGLDFPRSETFPAFMQSQRLPDGLRHFLRDYDPAGRFGLRLRVKPGEGGRPRVEGELEAQGVTCRYFRFPYEMNDARGFVRFSPDGITLQALKARHGTGRVEANGHVADSAPGSAFELIFTGEAIPLDGALYAALPESYQRLWNDAAPQGLCDVRVNLSRGPREADEPAGTRAAVEAELRGGSVRVDEQTRLTEVNGRVRVEEGRLEILGLRGFANGAELVIDGAMEKGPDGAPARKSAYFRAKDMQIDQTVSPPAADGTNLGDLRLTGVADVVGQVDVTPARDTRVYVAELRRGTVTSFDPGQVWRQAEGRLTVADGQVQLEGFRAGDERSWVKADGAVPLENCPLQSTLKLQAGGADLESLLGGLLPARWRHVRRVIGLAGAGELDCLIQIKPPEIAAPGLYVDVKAKAERAAPSLLPLDLRDVNGTVSITPSGYTLSSATGRLGPAGVVRLSGAGGWGEQDWADLRVDAQNVPLTDAVIEAMPIALRDLLRRLTAQGMVDVALDRVCMRSAGPNQWEISGQAWLKDAMLSLGLPVTQLDATLNGKLTAPRMGGPAVSASFVLNRGLIDGRPISEVQGRVEYSSASSKVFIHDVTGKLCDGQFVGAASLETDNGEHEITLTLSDVALADFIRTAQDDASRRTPHRPISGRLDGRVFVRGRGADPAQRVGGGELRIRGASLLASRVTASIAEESEKRSHPMDKDVDVAELAFTWEGETLRFSRVDIHTRNTRLVGRGSWNSRTDAISLTLVGAHPKDAARIAVLTDIAELAGQQLMQFRVDGVASAPRITVEPLHGLTEPIRGLLGLLAPK